MTTDYDPFRATLYEPLEAGRLVGLGAGRVRRWLKGYTYGEPSAARRARPIVSRSHAEPNGASFLDLIELWVARDFIDRGFSPQRVRRAFDEARHVTGLDHPFARRQFFVSGLEVILNRRAEAETPNLVHLLHGGQQVHESLVDGFRDLVEFDRDRVARWWPRGTRGAVVVDPERSFGSPIIERSGIRTSVLYEMYLAERQHAEPVARWMNIAVADVRRAVTFEQRRLAGRAALERHAAA